MKAFIILALLAQSTWAQDKTSEVKVSTPAEPSHRRYFFLAVDAIYALNNWTDNWDTSILSTAQKDSHGAYRLNLQFFPTEDIEVGLVYAYRSFSETTKTLLGFEMDPLPRDVYNQDQYGVEGSYRLYHPNAKASIWARMRFDYITFRAYEERIKDGQVISAQGASFTPGFRVVPMAAAQYEFFDHIVGEFASGVALYAKRWSFTYDADRTLDINTGPTWEFLMSASIGIAF